MGERRTARRAKGSDRCPPWASRRHAGKAAAMAAAATRQFRQQVPNLCRAERPSLLSRSTSFCPVNFLAPRRGSGLYKIGRPELETAAAAHLAGVLPVSGNYLGFVPRSQDTAQKEEQKKKFSPQNCVCVF